LPARSLSTEQAAATANNRWRHERGNLHKHVNRIVNAAGVLTDEEVARLALALVTRTCSAQNLPATIEDPATLTQVSAIIARSSP
jgi:hypothetical protein